MEYMTHREAMDAVHSYLGDTSLAAHYRMIGTHECMGYDLAGMTLTEWELQLSHAARIQKEMAYAELQGDVDRRGLWDIAWEVAQAAYRDQPAASL